MDNTEYARTNNPEDIKEISSDPAQMVFADDRREVTAEGEKTRESESYVQMMLDFTPMICSIWDENHSMIDCNMEAVKLLKLPDKKAYSERYGALDAPVQSNGVSSPALRKQYIAQAVEIGYLSFAWNYITADGEPLPTDTTLIRMPWKDSYRLLAYSRDLRELEAEKERAQEAEEYTQMMLDATPMVCCIWNESLELMDCNMEAVRLFELNDKSEYIDHFYHLTPAFQPDGMPSRTKAEAMIRKAFETGYQHFEWEYLIHTGQRIPADIVLIRVPYKNGYRVLGYSRDMREVNNAFTEVERHTNLLRAVNMVAENLMTGADKDFSQMITEQVRALGEAVNANGCRVWETCRHEGELCFRQTYSWSGRRSPLGGVAAELLRMGDIPHIAEKMLAGESVNSSVAQLPEKERVILEDFGVKAILAIPIIMHDGAWGMIAFENYINEDVLPSIYEQALKSCGMLIASSIIRNNTNKSLVRTRDDLTIRGKLLEAVNRVAKLLMDNYESNSANVVQQCLQILGESVGADRVSMWRKFENEDGVLCARRLPGWIEGRSFEESSSEIVIDIPTHTPEWDSGVLERKDINLPIRHMNDALRNMAILQQSKSLLLVHIEIDGEFWGFVGYAHSIEEHLFSETEIGILRSGGMMIASAIIRNEINDQLRIATTEALASVRAKNEFLARMSHEIRTPLNAVIGMTTIAQNSVEADKIQECLEIVSTSSRRLLSIINDVLDMSNIDLDKIHINTREFDFSMMLTHTIDALLPEAAARQQQLVVEFEKPFSHLLCSDEQRIAQVISNLVNNAIKFTQNGGTITVTICETPLGNGNSTLCLQVIDTGIGIDSSFIDHLFEPFEQADGSLTRTHGGSGLGLPICKTIVTMMGGEISAQSELGKGSCFTVRLPVTWGGPCDEAPRTGALRGDARILVVDDMPDVLAYLQNILGRFSLSCDTAGNAQEALRQLKVAGESGRPYDVVFLDWYLPDMQGGETIRHMQEYTSPPSIVLMSIADWAAIAQDATQADIARFIQKPLMPSAVFDALAELIGWHNSLPGQAEGADSAADTQPDWSSKTVLLVEDVEINRIIAIELLAGTGVQIECAENGEQALHMFLTAPQKYDLILMDLQMPVMDGYDATRHIRASGLPGAQTIPIYAMTAHTYAEDVEACMRAGMNGHIAKPIDFSVLLGAMEKAVS